MAPMRSIDSDSTVESRLRPGLSGWRGFFLTFLGWPVFAAAGVWALTYHFRAGPTREAALGLWALISGVGIIATWVTVRTAYIAVTPGQLQIGRSPRETIVEFSEIESLVEGLPAQHFLILKIGRFSPHNELASHRLAMMRRDAIGFADVRSRLKPRRSKSLFMFWSLGLPRSRAQFDVNWAWMSDRSDGRTLRAMVRADSV